ncbi:hypothetical protein TIFTF001_030228 [Ficus carica]|uniref:Uncharacterized protein n=1 Tax=Ficus carica TaxID=3494 RepID=A0AA88DSU2_FICCA|nr:hypothetical protein TIFTF001_030228 [Ficus carica]
MSHNSLDIGERESRHSPSRHLRSSCQISIMPKTERLASDHNFIVILAIHLATISRGRAEAATRCLGKSDDCDSVDSSRQSLINE